MKAVLLAAALLNLTFLTGRSENFESLNPGRYVLSLSEMAFKIEPAPTTKEVSLPALLKSKDTEISLETRNPDGKSVTFSGQIKSSQVYLWISFLEEGRVVTYHLTGKITSDHSASGEVSIFGSHEKAAGGKWNLSKGE